MTDTDITYNCCDGCGAECILPATEFPPGWVRLPISRRWRCPECQKALRVVNARTLSEEGLEQMTQEYFAETTFLEAPKEPDPVTLLSIHLEENHWPEAPKEEEK